MIVELDNELLDDNELRDVSRPLADTFFHLEILQFTRDTGRPATASIQRRRSISPAVVVVSGLAPGHRAFRTVKTWGCALNALIMHAVLA